ncbi:hypothetical protein AGMMS49938_12610 [Fibrobacterales bacterium]|nr:hypothetical protein AGMMS49938_12610 [Fibrobacterales bacterium]
MNIYFTGFMASGKTRIGKLIAEKLQMEYIDSDEFIVEREGKSIAEIFDLESEAGFRRIEKSAIKEIAKKNGVVVSLGGGAVTQNENIEVIKKSGLLIRMRATPEILSERIGRNNKRPLMANLSETERLEKVKTMLAAREQFYAEADFSVESDNEEPENRAVPHILSALEIWKYKALSVCTENGAKYPIFIGREILENMKILLESLNLLPKYEQLICTDSNVAEKQKKSIDLLCNTSFDHALVNNVYSFPAGETNKNLNELNNLWTYMLKNRYGRKTCLLQFGGGVVGDMAGFAAATYQRGISFLQIPTTLLAMVDSSVGGKVAINHPEGKNMIGAFYQPSAVVCDLSVLETLPSEEFTAGLAEIVKYGIIYDEEFFTYLEKNVSAVLSRESETLAYIIRRSCEIKAEVVGIDEKETGLRAILNYGHTFGHAIEKLTDYKKFSHGIAVGLGMRVAARLSTITGRWTENEENRQNDLLTKVGIPRTFEIDIEDAWNAMALDKKVDKQKRVYILPTKIGSVEMSSDPNKEQIFEAWKAINS